MLSACGGGGSSTSTPTVPTPPTPPTNSAPTLASANSDQSTTAGANFTYDATQNGATFSDADGDTLSYSVTYSPNNNGLSDENGVLSGAATQAGTYTITITADDGNGGQASDSFDIIKAKMHLPNIASRQICPIRRIFPPAPMTVLSLIIYGSAQPVPRHERR